MDKVAHYDRPRVAHATCRQFAQLADDDRLLIPALAERGVCAEPAVWDDPAVDWDAYDLVVVRSTWDYVDDRDKYLAWADSLPRPANTAGLDLVVGQPGLLDILLEGLPPAPRP